MLHYITVLSCLKRGCLLVFRYLRASCGANKASDTTTRARKCSISVLALSSEKYSGHSVESFFLSSTLNAIVQRHSLSPGEDLVVVCQKIRLALGDSSSLLCPHIIISNWQQPPPGYEPRPVCLFASGTDPCVGPAVWSCARRAVNRISGYEVVHHEYSATNVQDTVEQQLSPTK